MDLAWHEVDRKRVYDGRRKIDLVNFRLPNGKESTYELGQEGDSAVVLALTKDKEVILAKQFRPGKNAILLELPGGGIRPDQTPIQAAAAELLEETGYQGTLAFVATTLPDAYSTRRSHCFVATDCVKVNDQQLDPEEFIEVVILSLEDFKGHLRTGQLSDVCAGFLGLDFLGLL